MVSEGGVRCLPTSEVSRPVCRQQWRPHGPQSTGQLGPFRTQVVIVIYLSVVGALLLYMAFLMLVDPLIRKPDAYTERLRNEEESEVRPCRPPCSPPLGPRSLFSIPCSPFSVFSSGRAALCPPRRSRAALNPTDLASGSLSALAEGREPAHTWVLRPSVRLTVGLEQAPEESAEPSGAEEAWQLFMGMGAGHGRPRALSMSGAPGARPSGLPCAAVPETGVKEEPQHLQGAGLRAPQAPCSGFCRQGPRAAHCWGRCSCVLPGEDWAMHPLGAVPGPSGGGGSESRES